MLTAAKAPPPRKGCIRHWHTSVLIVGFAASSFLATTPDSIHDITVPSKSQT